MLDDRLFIDGGWVSSAARRTNTVGTPIYSVADGATGEALADEYTLVFTVVVAGVSATVTVTASSPNNPYGGQAPKVFAGVLLNNGVTTYKNVVPGVVLGFSNTTVNGNTGKVFVGQYLQTFDAFGEDAGVPSDALRHQVVNTGTGPVQEAEAGLKTHSVLVRKIGNAILNAKPFAEGATEKEDGATTQTLPYVLSISGVAGAGPAKTADLSVDGVLVPAAQLGDLNNAGAAVSGDNLKAVAGQRYKFLAPHALAGLNFAIDPNCANGDTANIMIFYSRHVQITPELAGAPDPDLWGTDPVPLTQAGQTEGTVQAAGEAFYWSRIVVPDGASAQKNPHPANVALDATETGAAAW